MNDITTTAAGYRIESIRLATVNGRNVKIFKAYKREGDTFIFWGEFTARARHPNRELWKVAMDSAPC